MLRPARNPFGKPSSNMKLHLQAVAVALPLVCGASISQAFVPGVPPLSGPGSVFHTPEVAPRMPTQKLKSKKKTQQPHARRQVLPKQSQ